MSILIDNIELDASNIEFNNAIEIIKHTNKLVYLTGKAGTGKTTFLKYLRSITNKNVVILAPTGIAAINAKGQTINSFFQIPFGPFVPNDKRLRTKKSSDEIDTVTIYETFKYKEEKKLLIENLELLIIDEISMVRCDQLDVIDTILRVFRKKNLPFGGVQVVLIGDTFQLPPIAKIEEWEIIKEHYHSPYFFDSKVYNENKPIYIELKKIYRQKEKEFIDLLNKVRLNQLDENELRTLNNKYNPLILTNNSQNFIILASLNSQVDSINITKLDELKSELKIFQGEISGVFPKNNQGKYILPTEENLHLKVGAQVMFLRNDPGAIKEYYNGKIGTITSLLDNKIIVEVFEKMNGEKKNIYVEKATWENIQYTWNKEKRKIEQTIIGQFIQYPLRLAWAITVHKSQGLTFEKVYADLGAAFEDGQVYVALSRCTSLNGLVLKSQIPRNAIKTSQKVLEFAKNETPSTLINEELKEGKADFYYKLARKNILERNLNKAYADFLIAISFRNDMETELFKRYLNIVFSRLVGYKDFFEKQLSENKHIEDAKKALEIMSKAFIEENLELSNSNETFKAKINEQNKAIKLVIDENKEIELEKIKLTSEMNQLTNQLLDINQTVKTLEDRLKIESVLISHKEHLINLKDENIKKMTVENKNNLEKISHLLITNQGQQNEIHRLRNLKWYQKLIGNK